MSKIRLLSAQEIKLIAAGEVVESPASIIKELIENACDAQSSTISLSIEDGGISSIIVSDNGTGITEEDLPLALLPHATSKLNAFIDGYIENNNHYGFRGEALAAISGVSEVTIHTKTAYTTHGYAITSKESKINDISPIGCNEGTTIFVKDLFGSIPARKKYLPSKGTLEKQIAYTFQGLALGKPTINISYKKDNKIIYNLQKKERFVDRASDFLTHPKTCYEEMFHCDEYCTIEGLISSFEYGQYDRSKMYILVNGRLVKQAKLTHLCIKAYQSEQFQKRFPEIFIQITVPHDQIDINVHPRKEEVLFLYQKKIESILFKTIIETLDNRTKKLMLNLLTIDNKQTIQKQSKDQIIKETNQQSEIKEKENIIPALFFKTKKEEGPQKQDIFIKKKEFDIELTQIVPFQEIKKIDQDKNTTKKKISHQLTLFEKQDVIPQYIGTLDKTYVLFLKEKSIILIDQHALHEKILYQDFMKKMQEKKTAFQPLLFPEKQILTKEEILLFKKYQSSIEKHFFLFSNEEEMIIIKETNNRLEKITIKEIINIILKEFQEREELTEKEIVEHIWHEVGAMYACKHAIKGGDTLSEKQRDTLIKEASQNDNIFFCPHGRPSYYEMHVGQIEKLFKRNE